MRPPRWVCRAALAGALGFSGTPFFTPELAAQDRGNPQGYYQMQVVDDQSGRGVPLVELETVNHLRFVTDSAGRVAFFEPGLMGRPIFFHVRSHGYDFPKDGFGYAGTSLTPVAGKKDVLRIKRLNVAERLYRLTGEGLYRDSVLLGEKVPLAEPLGAGRVAGQDSAGAVVHRGKIYWFWGDTGQMKYPLGHFWTAGATAELPGHGGLDPAQGVDYRYFTDAEGFSRPLCRLGVKTGLVWIDGLAVVRDDAGHERLLARYAHMESLAKMLGQGLAVFNDEKQEFEKLKEIDLAERWRFPHGHPTRVKEDGAEYLYFGEVFAHARVLAGLRQVLEPTNYEAWTCVAAGAGAKEERVERGADGQLRYAWRSKAKPLSAAEERQLIESGQIKPEEAWYQPVDVDTGKPVQMHGGSVCWNAYRKRWLLIAVQQGGSSFLGEVWYAEAPQPTGPWRQAKKIVTHANYTFYNPVQHAFFDQAGGRFIYFEGTYANTFSGNPDATPRYDYNQIMYRLDLDDPRLKAVRSE